MEQLKLHRAAIIASGDEILRGRIVDQNSAVIARHLTAFGIEVVSMQSCGDDVDVLVATLQQAAEEECDLIVLSGGLGPTADDLTRDAIAAYLGAPLVDHPEAHQIVEAAYQRSGRQAPAEDRQYFCPLGATPLDNAFGSAPGLLIEGPPMILCLSGVPQEMEDMLTRHLLVRLEKNQAPMRRLYYVVGPIEADLSQRLGSLLDRDRDPLIGITSNLQHICLDVLAIDQDNTEQFGKTCEELETLLDDDWLGPETQSLPEAVVKLCQQKSLKLATAESCTGGMVAEAITSIPGSSSIFRGSLVAYDNGIKENLGRVSPELLLEYGAVSEEVVKDWARHSQNSFDCELAIAISGIAGPDGGSPEKPVGTVCIAWAVGDELECRTFHLLGDRDGVRRRALRVALDRLRRELLKL